MKKYKDFMNEDVKIDVEDLPPGLHINQRQGIDFGPFGMEAIAVLGQRGGHHDRYLFPADGHDIREFGKKLKADERLFRISTIASKPGVQFDRPIVKINALTGKIAFIDDRLYADEDIVKWERPKKYQFLTVDDAKISLFGMKY